MSTRCWGWDFLFACTALPSYSKGTVLAGCSAASLAFHCVANRFSCALLPEPLGVILPANVQLFWAYNTSQPDLSLLGGLGKYAKDIMSDMGTGSQRFQTVFGAVSLEAQRWAAAGRERTALQLERRQREAGLDPLLTASAAHRLLMQLHVYGVSWAAEKEPAQAHDMLVAALQSCTSLVALEPGNAGFWLMSDLVLGRLGRPAQAAAMQRRALAAAQESGGEAHSPRRRGSAGSGPLAPLAYSGRLSPC